MHDVLALPALFVALAGVAGIAVLLGLGPERADPRSRVRLGAALGVAVVAPVLVGLSPVAGPGVLVVCAGAAWWGWRGLGVTPGAWSHRTRLVADAPVEPNIDLGPRPLVRALGSLSTRALCREWQRSFVVLRAATDGATGREVAALRRRYLDELEHRDPEGVARWLAADPRPAAGDPGPHLTPEEEPPHGRAA